MESNWCLGRTHLLYHRCRGITILTLLLVATFSEMPVNF